jgi:hypothetical protein
VQAIEHEGDLPGGLLEYAQRRSRGKKCCGIRLGLAMAQRPVRRWTSGKFSMPCDLEEFDVAPVVQVSCVTMALATLEKAATSAPFA